MQINKLLVIISIIAAIPIIVNGQTDYYAIDNNVIFGAELIDGGESVNSRICKVKKGDKILEYSPKKVQEYGFKDGRIYISKEIQLSDSKEKVFLEQLQKGTTTLYYYHGKNIKTYFLEKDSTLFLEIPKKDENSISYREQLLALTSDCSNVIDASRLSYYNKNSLTRLVKTYNDCELKPFPHFRFGFSFGNEFTKLVPALINENENVNYSSFNEDYIDYFEYRYESGLMVGFFLDKPLFVHNLSFHAELNYSQQSFSYSSFVDEKNYDLIANLTSFQLPLLVRYTSNTNKIRAFLNLGGIFTNNFQNENSLVETVTSGEGIERNDLREDSLLANNQLGFSIGGGIEKRLNYRNSLFFEIRANKNYGLTKTKSLDTSTVSLTLGVNL